MRKDTITVIVNEGITPEAYIQLINNNNLGLYILEAREKPIITTESFDFVMDNGKIQQVGTPTEVFDMPINLFVAEFIGAPKMNTFKTNLVTEGGKYYVAPYGAKIEVTGQKADSLKEKGVQGGKITLGVRPEHFKLTDANDPAAIACKITVNEMMGSELHLHVVEDNGDKLIVRIPTVSLEDEQRKAMAYGNTIHITFEGKVMHFFDPETETNLLV